MRLISGTLCPTALSWLPVLANIEPPALRRKAATDRLVSKARAHEWKLSDSDLCSCGETQTMSHIDESCPQTRLHGGLSKLHSADDDAVAWLTSYGS